MFTINKISSYLLLSLFTIPFLASWVYYFGSCVAFSPILNNFVVKCAVSAVDAATFSYNVFINFVSFDHHTIFGMVVVSAFILALLTRIVFLVKYKNVAAFIFSPVMLSVFMYLSVLFLTL